MFIPLLMSDVVYAAVNEESTRTRSDPLPDPVLESCRVTASHVLTIGPRPEPEKESAAGTAGVPSVEEVWVLCIANCDSAGVQGILFELGRLGALRWDLQSVYTIEPNILGEGSSAKVYSGHAICTMGTDEDKMTEPRALSEVALKMCRKSNASVTTIRKEVNALVGAQGHPNLLGFYGVFFHCQVDPVDPADPEDSDQDESTGFPYPRWCMVMSLCDGTPLHKDLDSKGPMSIVDAVPMFVDVLSGLDHLHSHSIVHRDVKADNILQSGKGYLLADLGMAEKLDEAVSLTRRCGTPGYAAPEIVLGRPYDQKVDMFSMGVVCYFAITGDLPFWGFSIHQVMVRSATDDVSFGHDKFRSVPRDVIAVIESLLSKEPGSRPTARVALSALQQLASDQAVHNDVQAKQKTTISSCTPTAVEVLKPVIPKRVSHVQPLAPAERPPELPNQPSDQASENNSPASGHKSQEMEDAIPQTFPTRKPGRATRFFRWARARLARPVSSRMQQASAASTSASSGTTVSRTAMQSVAEPSREAHYSSLLPSS
eukprot:TRINITY_DN33360_c0_g1_i1.p1 TRINITY_DN33360_c0_g1~~TRINITY_DN33360_c0_g1_i1.p1  ORF type:complete len:577 (+),score=64.69 TRINITY_DN33360_c0_g1_i1:108-1733(+)